MRVETQVWIAAPVELVFDLARDLDIHARTTSSSGERVVWHTGSTRMELGDEATFEARHLGVTQRLTSKIVAYERPWLFVDEMQRGAFKRLRHEHVFEDHEGGTLMIDRLEFEAPLGLIGHAFSRLFLGGYMRRFLELRGQELKMIAEKP